MASVQEYTYAKRLGYVCDSMPLGKNPGVTIDGVRWGTIGDVIAVFPDVLDNGRHPPLKPLPSSVAAAMSTYDGMVTL